MVKPIMDLEDLENDDGKCRKHTAHDFTITPRFIVVLLITSPVLLFKDILQLSPDKAALCFHICELLSFIIRNHSFRSKYFILSTNITSKISLLFRTSEKYVKLGW